ncbi:MAG: hypothetical protein JXR91_04070 [Deltaproteobacteria bacterium]|nr:hypothetical protein [Deltaproteobacteria bacterium]
MENRNIKNIFKAVVLMLFVIPINTLAQDDSDQSIAENGEAQSVEPAEETSEEPLPVNVEDKSGGEKFASIFSLADKTVPEAPVEGIDGGTLKGTNGLQWPYFTSSTIGVSGELWIDTSFKKGESTKEGEPNEKQMLAQGRGVLRISPTYIWTNNWFIQGQMELVADKNQSKDISQLVSADDVWLKFGQWGKKHNNWDLQMGRYQGWRLFNLGMGLDLNTQERKGAQVGSTAPPEFYGVTYMYYRPSSNITNIALHYYPVKFLRVEGLMQTGFDSLNNIGGRGALIFDLGWLKIKGGGEYKKKSAVTEGAKNEEKMKGAGGAVQFVIAPWVEAGGQYAFSSQSVVKFDGGKNQDATFSKWSTGGFLNVSPFATFGAAKYLTVGGGLDYTSKWDSKEDEFGNVGIFSHLQAFGAISYRLFGKLLIKGVFAYAKGNMNPTFADNTGAYQTTMLSGRLRLQYSF